MFYAPRSATNWHPQLQSHCFCFSQLIFYWFWHKKYLTSAKTWEFFPHFVTDRQTTLIESWSIVMTKISISVRGVWDFIILIEVIDGSQPQMRISQILACYGWSWHPTSILLKLQPHQSTFHLDNWQVNLHYLENRNPRSSALVWSGEVNQRCWWLHNVTTIVLNNFWLISGFPAQPFRLGWGLDCFDWKFPNCYCLLSSSLLIRL